MYKNTKKYSAIIVSGIIPGVLIGTTLKHTNINMVCSSFIGFFIIVLFDLLVAIMQDKGFRDLYFYFFNILSWTVIYSFAVFFVPDLKLVILIAYAVRLLLKVYYKAPFNFNDE